MRDDPFKDQMITHTRRYYNETIRSHNTISGEDCRDLTKINQQRKRVGYDKVSRTSNCVKIVRKSGAVVTQRKQRVSLFCEVGCPKVKLEQEGQVSCGKICLPPNELTRVLCVRISQHGVLRSIHCYKQVTLSTSETPVKEGLRRNYHTTALLSQTALRSQIVTCCEGLFCSRQGTKYHSGDFCGRSRRVELSPH